MDTLKPRLDRINLNARIGDSFNETIPALFELLAPHVPHSLSILGVILNAGPRPSALQNIDLSKVSLWSTIPLNSASVNAIRTTNFPPLFSMVVFFHLHSQFRFFCSAESSPSDDLKRVEMEETHVKEVFQQLQEIAGKAHPTYNSRGVCLLVGSPPKRRVDTDPPMIAVGGVHERWKRVLSSMSTAQNPIARYVFPPGSLTDGSSPILTDRLTTTLQGGSGAIDLDITQIKASDLPFVRGASSIPRSRAYLLARLPYSVCFRSTGKGVLGSEGAIGWPVACVLMHADGSIGALHVDSRYQRRGLGRLVIRALIEALDFSKGLNNTSTSSFHDLGGGALGWNWTDTTVHNEAGNRFFGSMVGKQNTWTCHWTYMLVEPDS